MLARIQIYIVKCAYIYLFVSSNLGVYEGTLALESEEWKRVTQENKQVRVEIWKTLCDQSSSFFFGVSCVHVADPSTLWHFKDLLSSLGTPKGVGVGRRM